MITFFSCGLTSSRISKDDLTAIIGAAQLQLADDYAVAWEKKPGVISLNSVVVGDNSKFRVVYCYFRESTPADDANAVAYHWVNPDNKQLEIHVLLDRVAQDANNRGLTCVDATSIAFTHEVIETEGDEFADDWTDVGDGTEEPKELCDRVQGWSYPKSLKDSNGNERVVLVTDFLLPDAFNDNPPDGASYDFLNKLTSPFEVGDGGYTGSRGIGSTETTVLGDRKNALAYSHKAMARRGVNLEELRKAL
jgi:hypothetical protein